jgi:hypothetical protein
MEEVSNTSTVALRVIENHEKEPGVWGYNWDTGGYKYRDMVLQVGGWGQG